MKLLHFKMQSFIIILFILHFEASSQSGPLTLVSKIQFENPIKDIVFINETNKILFVETSEFLFGNKNNKEIFNLKSIDLKSNKISLIEESEIKYSSICISIDEKYYSTADYKGNIKIRRILDNSIVYYHKGDGKWIYKHMFLHDENKIIFINAVDKYFKIINVKSKIIDSFYLGKQINTFDIFNDLILFGTFQKSEVWTIKMPAKILELELEKVNCLYSADNFIAAGLSNGDIKILDKKFQIHSTLSQHFKPVLDISINGNFMLSSSSDQSFILWNLESNEILEQKLNIHRGSIENVVFVRDGIVSSGEDKSLMIWKYNYSNAIETNTQLKFKLIKGKKANYSIEIPDDYIENQAIGSDIDLKYGNSKGVIVTSVQSLPANMKDNNIDGMILESDDELIDILESNGLQDITFIKRGFIYINNIKSYFAYYKTPLLYFHTITLFNNGKAINVIYTCELNKKEINMPIVNRIVQSLNTF